MTSAKWILVIVGVLLILAGIVFSLQGANILGGSALMSGNPTYVYVGAVVAVVGLILVIAGARMKGKAHSTPPAEN
jgi:protein-S-isoprenylcysteine O-methyltransferase Ste14